MAMDILQEMNITEASDVFITLGRDAPDSIHIHFFILNFIIWSEYTDAVDMHFYCPHGNSRDGSVYAIARFKNGPTFITFHCVDLHFDYILKHLNETKIIDWNEDIIFEAIHEKFTPILRIIIAEKKLKIVNEDVVHQVWLNYHKRKEMLVLVPDPLYIAPMRKREFKFIKQNWEYYSSELEPVINTTLENNCVIGLYHRSNDSLMGWAVEQHFGGIGMLYVLEEYRNQGYGATIIQAMCHRMIDRQIDPYAFIHINNSRSLALFEKVGFKKINLAHWVHTIKSR
uniref:N-acetyltransferase domain-containing protein n=1 Tax=Clastoptera arizonana TaxID=38151 RepID=A0A1B6D630_9HEMI